MSFAKYIERMYTDKLTIVRYVEADNADGTSGVVRDTSKDINGISCHISALKEDERDTSNWDIDETVAKVKIFLSPGVEIQKGDEIIAERYVGGKKVQTYKGYAGDPMVYDLAQQFILLEKRVKS